MSGRYRRGVLRAFVLLTGVVAVACVGRWPVVAQAEQLPAPSFAEALRTAADLPRLHSLLVSYRGEIVLERYFNGRRASQLANIKSASKSVLSALVGIAIDRGLIGSVEQPIAAFFPDLLQEVEEPAKREITVEHLLTMTSGLQSTSNRNYGAWVQSGNWVQHALTRPLLSEPGTRRSYSTGNTHLLSAILTQVSETSTWQFARDMLSRPMGFELARWPRDPQGIYFGGNDMQLTPRQMVAFGELYLNRGRLGGAQIVPAEWIDVSLIPRTRSEFSNQLYGYGWWMRWVAGRQAYYAWGYGGQYIYIVPSLELVVVSTSSVNPGDGRRGHRRRLDDLIERLIVRRLAATPGATAVH